MSQKNKVEVRIGGKIYKLVGVDPDEYIQKIGLYVDKKMNEVQRVNTNLSTSMAAVLTALNVADDFIKSKENGQALERELEEKRNKVKQLTAQTENLIVERERLSKQKTDLQLELAKREAELREVRNNLAKVSR
ncbi:MAG: cell division protein ZapA [Eubacteriales bacterium]|nr:cell division protein ZapA [Eubacteriales bacterium]